MQPSPFTLPFGPLARASVPWQAWHGWTTAKTAGLAGIASVRHGLEWVSHHTGAPIVLVAAVAIVVSWRIAKRSMRLLVEVALVAALLIFATQAGWIHW